jgi:hypothetical protein
MPRTALVVPFHNELDRLSSVIRALRNQASHEVKIVFVDNRSTDGSAELVRELEEVTSRRWHCLTEDRVGKYHAMRSATESCVRELDASVVGFLDADSYPTDDRWLCEASLIADEAGHRLGFIHSSCEYNEHDAWPNFHAACGTCHAVVEDFSRRFGWFANAAGGFFSVRLLQRYFGVAEPATEIGLRMSLFGLWLGLEGHHNGGTVRTSARRIVRDPVSFKRWCTYSREFYLDKDLNRKQKIDLSKTRPVPDLTPAQLQLFFRRQAVKMSCRTLVPMALLGSRGAAEPGEHALGALGLAGLDPSEGGLANLSIAAETLTTSRFEAFLQRIERSALCRRVAEAVEQRLNAAFESRGRSL